MTLSRRGFLLTACLLPIVLPACQQPPPGNRFPLLTFQHLPDYRLDVARVEVNEAYQTKSTPPNVEGQLPQPPANVLRHWAEDRLVAAGDRGRAVFAVKDASIVEQELERTEGLEGVFTTDQSTLYRGRLSVALYLYGAGGRVLAHVNAEALRQRSVAEDATLNERERIWFQLMETMVQDLNDELERQIAQHLQAYLRA